MKVDVSEADEAKLITPLRTARVNRGLTQAQVAHSVGVSQSYYGRVEKGLEIPKPELAHRLALHFGNLVTRDQILFPADYQR